MGSDQPRVDWPRLVGLALAGEDLGFSEAGDADASGIVAWLAGRGWGAARLQQHRHDRQAAQQPWPHPLPDGVAVPSWAQLHSLVAQVRELAGLDGLHATVHAGPKVLGPAERRLLADKPPHHL